MGFVSAQEVSDFKFNSDFKDVGDGVFIKYGPTGQAEQSMAVVRITLKMILNTVIL